MMDDAEVYCRKHWPGLVRTLTAYTGDAALAQDLAQEALATVLLRWPRVQRMASPGSYVYRVGINLAKDAVARLARERPTAGVGDGAESAMDHTARLDVEAAVAALPVRQRLAVSLRYLADLSIAQTAEVMGCRPGTVRALCHQATQALRASPDLDWHPATRAPIPHRSKEVSGDA